MLNVAYREPASLSGAQVQPRAPVEMLRDVLAFTDQARAAFPDQPLCTFGQSAGGQLALMAAIERPGLSCVVDEAGPTDLAAWRTDAERGAGPGLHTCAHAPTYTWFYVYCYVARIFPTTKQQLAFWSPARRFQRRHDGAALFLGYAGNDPIVPAVNALAMAQDDPAAELHLLPGDPGGTAFVHSSVTAASLTAYSQVRQRFLLADGRSARSPARSAPAAERLAACNARLRAVDWAKAPRTDRVRLLLAGFPWDQGPDPAGSVLASFSCSGSERSNDDGINLYVAAKTANAPPAPPTSAGSVALLAPAGTALRTMTTAWRGLLGGGWTLSVEILNGAGRTTVLLTCNSAAPCSSVTTARRPFGQLLAAPGGEGDPDASDTLPEQRFVFPPDTRRVTVTLACAVATGCARATINAGGDVTPASHPTRAREPNGSPAVVSLYDPVLTLSPTR